MALIFLEFPWAAIDKICNFSNDKTLIEMRQVCKSTKAVIDCLVSTLSNVHSSIYFSGRENRQLQKKEMGAMFFFRNRRHELLWKFCLLSALTSLKLENGKSSLLSSDTEIELTITAHETVLLLDHLHNSIERKLNYTYPTFVALYDLELTTVQTLAAIFDKTYVDHLTMDIKEVNKQNSAQWLDVIEKLKTNQVGFNKTSDTEDFHSFLVLLADMVERIGIGINSRRTTSPLPIAVVKQIFSGRCCFFETSTGRYSIADAENIIQYLQHLERKVYFGAYINSTPMDIVVGEYNLAIVDPNSIWPGRFEHLESENWRCELVSFLHSNFPLIHVGKTQLFLRLASLLHNSSNLEQVRVMAVYFLRIPRKAIEIICTFSNGKTLLAMRQVSKANKTVVDCLVSTLTNVKSEIRITEIRGFGTKKISVLFVLIDRRNELLWKCWLLAAFTVLKIPKVNYIGKFPDTNSNFNMTVKEAVKLLRYLHLFVQRNINYTFPYWLTLYYLELSTIKALPTFINKYYIHHITVDFNELEKPESDQWLAIIKRIGTKTVCLTETLITEESHSFLVQLSDIVDKIGWSSRNPTTRLPLSIVKQILCRRCSCFITSNGTYSLKDAENMIKYLQHLGRRVYFEARIQGAPTNIIIGEYNMKIAGPNTIEIGYIKHLEKNREASPN